MAPTNRQRVDEALLKLTEGLTPFFQQLVTARYGEAAWIAALTDRHGSTDVDAPDLSALGRAFHAYRNDLFRDALGNDGVNFMHEALSVRNAFSHTSNPNMSTSDTLRALDTVQRLLLLANAPELSDQVQKSHELVLRSLYSERARSETRRVTETIRSDAHASLTSWRDVATPHEDVRTGNLKEAEFAADLDQVHKGLAGEEYRDPVEFFRRTYLTDGLSNLLANAIRRLTSNGGDPVLELQTNFGGGKTHSMIALYHLASGKPLRELPGLDPVMDTTGLTDGLFVQRAVLVGSKLSANESRVRGDGTVVRTLWGDLAWQLAGEQGYAKVAESDRSGTAPGADVLQEVFEIAGDSLILIDEWVAFVRNLYFTSNQNPVAGSWDANLSFAQSLTEAVTNTPGVLLAASLPSSDIEAGGEGGKEALRTLRHTFSRVKASWRPASTSEGFEIVRRRLFQEVEPANYGKRDGTIELFWKMYSADKNHFPSKVREDYRRRMHSAYPFHPETFDLLFEKWGTLENFQRTRGVLRLMANVVHTLWTREDRSPLIMPANIPLDAHGVVTELDNYLPDTWTSVIESDIDGDNARSLILDKENSNYDRYSATRRVARAIFLGSAPTHKADNKGISDQEIRLAVAQPGETVAVFGDALRNFSQHATYLYDEHGHYWFSTTPSVAQLAQQRVDAMRNSDIDFEISRRLTAHQSQRGEFVRVVIHPRATDDVADTPEATLVLLGVGQSYSKSASTDRGALHQAEKLLDERGDARRINRNAVVFLAPDANKLTELRNWAARAAVWSAIVQERETLNLEPSQARQAESQARDADSRANALIKEAWCWLLIPRTESAPQSPVEWDIRQLRGVGEGESLAEAASKRVVADEALITRYSGIMLRSQIEQLPAFRDGWTHILARDLATWFPSYLYLPRLKNTLVLEMAIRGAAENQLMVQVEGFAWADGFDEASGTYLGLTWDFSREGRVSLTGGGMIVHPDVARNQFDEQEAKRRQLEASTSQTGDENVPVPGIATETGGGMPGLDAESAEIVPAVLSRRYFGSKSLNTQTLASHFREVLDSVISPLQSMYGVNLRVTVEIQAEVPDGISEDRKQEIRERSESLRFEQSDFAE